MPEINATASDGMVFVKNKKEIWEAMPGYVLSGGEEFTTKEEFIKYQENNFANKVIKGFQENNIILKIDNYMDNAEYFYKVQPYFYNENGILWFWNKDNSCYEIKEDIEVMEIFDRLLGFYGQTVNSRIKNACLEAIKRYGIRKKPKDAPKKWIQFKNKAVSLESGNTYDVKPNYFFTNPIPWDIGETDETPVMDKLFNEWVGEKYVKTLYELIAYCCYSDYPIQLLFCLFGAGRNGKSCFLKILNKFIGEKNVCTTSLDLLSGNNRSRFESTKLYKKLVAVVGETNFGILENTCLLKQLTGGDKIGFEMKGKQPFDEYSYAKIIIASNSLPTSQDTSDGFYRRWLIVDFPNQFPEGKDITKQIHDIEFNNLAKKITKLLPELINNGKFTNQGDIQERKIKYIEASNPLSVFIEKCCIKDNDAFVLSSELYTAYIHYLSENKKRRVKSSEFKSALEDEGYWIEKTTKYVNEQPISTRWIERIKLKDNWKELVKKNAENDKNDTLSTPPIYLSSEWENSHNCHFWHKGKIEPDLPKEEQIEQDSDVINYWCSICYDKMSNHWHTNGKPICHNCYNQLKINNQ